MEKKIDIEDEVILIRKRIGWAIFWFIIIALGLLAVNNQLADIKDLLR